ncbi:CHAT domain-containing protein [Sphaerotilus sp.]|uniref:CHAT domain-containing protein n=1 Tax=Sphaerotilus sp. TaxID=2093942 RepID=UPI00286DC0D4|nr:CHAT domain-containing protein [Sphaerotilus sp.]
MDLRATPQTATLPALLKVTGPRGTAADPPTDTCWLPPGFLQARQSLSITDAPDAPRLAIDSDPDAATDGRELLALVLADGSTWLTTAARLDHRLKRHLPGLADADGAWRLDRLPWPDDSGPRPPGKPGPLVVQVHVLAAGGAGAEPDPLLGHLGAAPDACALMRAIEAPLAPAPGLYRWDGQSLRASTEAPSTQPMLVLLHDLASNTAGSFADLASRDRALWSRLERHYPGGVWALEHHTWSESPLRNAIDLLDALPVGARVSLLSHGRGGLVGDLLCLRGGEAEMAHGVPDTAKDPASEAQRALLQMLASRLGTRLVVVQRHVRVASPSAGLPWLAEHPDLFLSSLLAQIGQVPRLAGHPLHAAARRAVVELIARRIEVRSVPGLAALLPDAPLARLLLRAAVQPDIDMAVIAGNADSSSLLCTLGAALSDCLDGEQRDHDLLVGTDSMLGGVAVAAQARVLLDRGRQVAHWRYFTNDSTRRAALGWLSAERPQEEPGWTLLTGNTAEPRAAAKASRSTTGPPVPGPVVLILPGLMASHLRRADGQRVWFDPQALPLGGLTSVAWEQPVEADAVFDAVCGDLADHLSATHRVETFPYDWRQPLDVLGDRLGERLSALLRASDQPVRLLAHGLGGLVVRACILRRRAVVDELMRRDGARLVMLGTPHHGTYAAVEALLGKSAALRGLVWRDTAQPMSTVLATLAEFRGLLQLLPQPGSSDADGNPDFQHTDTWTALGQANRDRWFGDTLAAVPRQQALDAGSWLWRQATGVDAALPAAYADRTIAVHGVARHTPCGVRIEAGRLQMVATARGDGTVTWASGQLDGIGRHYYLPADHGELTTSRDGFPALTELLERGATRRIPSTPPATRDTAADTPTRYDAGPPEALDTALLMRGLSGGTRRPSRPAARLTRTCSRTMNVQVRAGDLRFVSTPLMVGHYEHDPIAGPQAVVDRELLDGALSERYRLGLYAGPRGSATVVISPPNDAERRRGSLRGAIVVGLGRYDGALGARELTESVRTGALRYLMQAQDVLGGAERALSLSTLLIGYNSSLNLTVAASVDALVRGVLEANQRFAETARARLHIERLEIVEMYLDTAISAVHALRSLAGTLSTQARLADIALTCQTRLVEGDGLRPRLADTRNASYWPRLIVTDARTGQPCQDGNGSMTGSVATDTTGDASDGRPRMADCLRFLYVGQRARAESVVQQRQPGLIEALVQQHNGSPVWNEHIGRMLFHLMVPHDFKDTARQLERIVLVVDDATANVPWELLYAPDPDDEKTCIPLSLRTPVVRQLNTTQYRPRVRQSLGRSVLMVGNPCVRGFATGFRGRDGSALTDPDNLPGAEAEAQSLTALMTGLGHDVLPLIGPVAATATQVLGSLLGQPFRIVHISAHGVHQLPHRDGRLRSGVVLSDGLLLTAAEIEAMEAVPELVFLNCCHQGVVVGGDLQGNRLAASLAQRLIGIGVRCVIVAGWAVSDTLAAQFGQVFYEALLRDNQPFGDAVFKARKAIWEQDPGDVTWGAFQAYGDPAWQAEAGGERSGTASEQAPPVSVEELLDELSRHSALASRRLCLLNPGVLADQRAQLADYIARRIPADWQDDPLILSALGTTWAELDDPEKACAAYRAALQHDDPRGRVPVRAIEQLAVMEARWGERSGNASLIRQALQRLEITQRLIGPSDQGEPVVSPEHCALRGGSHVHMASLYAAMVLQQADNPTHVRTVGTAMFTSLEEAIAAYTLAEGGQGTQPFSPFHAINRLSLDAITPWESEDERVAARRLATEAGEVAAQRFGLRDNFWNAVMVPEARLVEVLLDGDLGRPDAPALAEVRQAYAQALSNLTVKPRQIDSVMARLRTLSCLFDAMVLFEGPRRANLALNHWWTAEHLLTLCEALLPGSQPRRDRPPRPLRPRPAPPPGAS